MERWSQRRTCFVSFVEYHKVWLSYRNFNRWGRKKRIFTLSTVWIYGNKRSKKMGYYKHVCKHYIDWSRKKIRWWVKNLLKIFELYQRWKVSCQIGSFKDIKKRLFWMVSWGFRSGNIKTRTWCHQQTCLTFGLPCYSF